MRNIITSFTTFLLHIISFFFIYNFLQTTLNKMFRSDFYVIIIFVLLAVAPIVVFYLSNRIFYKKSGSKNIIKSIVCTDIYLLIFGVLYCYVFLENDTDFICFALWINIFWVLMVSIFMAIKTKTEVGSVADKKQIDSLGA